MRYLNRQRLGIEAFLAARSTVFSRQNELDVPEFMLRLRLQPFSVREQILRDVRSALRELTNGKYDTDSLIPQEVADIVNASFGADSIGRIRPFFEWLQALWRDNDQARSLWKSHLHNAASSMNAAAGDCLLAISSGYSNQRALLQLREDGVLELSLHERRWGRLCLHFPNVSDLSENSVPVLGFMYIIESEAQSDGRYRFDMLFDTEFSLKTDSVVRALRSGSWHQLSFTCDAPTAELAAVDYARAADIRGASRLESVRYCSEVLCEKAALSGESLLSAAERTALPAARLISASKTLSDKGKKSDIRSENILLELAENRYAFERLCGQFTADGSEEVVKLLKKIEGFIEMEDADGALRQFRRLPKLMDSLCSYGELMPLLLKLHDIMSYAGDCDEDSSTREAVFRKAAEAFSHALEPQLSAMGFQGTYPHYRRIKHGKAQYISAVVADEAEALDGSCLNYAFTLCAAQAKMKASQRKSKKIRGIDFDLSFSTDFFNERPEYSHSGLTDCAAEPGSVPVTVDILSGETAVYDEGRIEKMLKCANRAFKGFSLKRKERKLRRSHTDKKERKKIFRHAFLDAFTRFAPSSAIMCIVVAGLYLWGKTQSEFVASIGIRTAVFPIAFAGIITALLRALFYCLRRRKKLWVY